MRGGRSGKPVAVACQSPPARSGIAARQPADGRRPARPDAGRAVRSAHRRRRFSTRRAVYGFIERQNLPAFFRTFDFANPNTHTPERPQTVAPQQALFLMNSPFVIEQAAHLAKRSKTSSDAGQPLTTSDEAADLGRIVRLFEYALGREPLGDETGDALEFVRAGEAKPDAREARWERLAQVLLMSNEFAFVD